jgi:hypothetical protein
MEGKNTRSAFLSGAVGPPAALVGRTAMWPVATQGGGGGERSSEGWEPIDREAFRDYIRAAGRGPIAQRLEQGTHNPLVPGSNPGGPTFPQAVCASTAWGFCVPARWKHSPSEQSISFPESKS